MCLLQDLVVASPSQGVPEASGPAAKVKESSLGGLYNPFLRPNSLGLPGSRKLAGVYVAGHVTEKSNIQFLKRHFGTASPFDTLSRRSSHALRKMISLGHKEPHCK